jgi:choline dehydrogenase
MEQYDYIIVGGGSAGCVVAARLSEDSNNNVLLIEAGPPADAFWINTPAGMGKLFLDKRYNWGFLTAPVPTLGGRTVYWPRGKTLGGTSSINGMIYSRGHPLDYDHWAKLGNTGWCWEDVLPYFIKSEHNEHGTSSIHGGDGPLYVSAPVTHHPTTDDFIEAATHVGIPRLEELNAPPYEGVAYQQFTIRNGRRQSTYVAFIKPAQHRKNLTVVTNVLVLRLVVNSGEATGVEVLQNGQRRIIHAAREVILSGGALSSPHVLMHSGIGHGADLQRFGIPIQVHLPGVGKNLQDHWNSPFVLRSTLASSYNRNLHGIRKYLEGMRYLLTGRGYLAMGASAVSAYIRSSPDQPQPDIQLAIRAMTANFLPDGSVEVDSLPGLSGAAVLVGPKSTGHMELTSSDPLVPPAFYPNYLAHPEDVERILVGMRLLRRIFATGPLSKRIVAELSPGPTAITDEQLIEHAKQNGGTSWHQACTCKMGSDEMAVVDAQLRVRGIRRLRVVDASVMPRITRGNTNAPTIMIAEKASDMIRKDLVPRRAF